MPALPQLSGRQLLLLAIGLLAAGLVLLGLGVAAFALSSRGSGAKPAVSTTSLEGASMPATGAGSSAAAAGSASTAASPRPAPSAVPTPGVIAPAPAAASSLVGAYYGLGSWVDIYDDRAWNDPAAAVADMAGHGVRTLYLETGNSRSAGELFKSAQLRQFIAEAHAHDMKIVAWYLPDMTDPAKDFARVNAAIQLRTPDGQKFDSFALDIESGAVKTQQARNRTLMTLSRQIRDAAGPSYPLGAITPSPVGLSRKGSYWSRFPYSELAGIYDVFLPMGYYTYHGKGAKLAYSDTVGNARIIRAQPGCSAIPIHMIGGEAEKTTTAEVAAFVRGARDVGCVGASLYGWAGTKADSWQALQGVGAGKP